MNVGDIITEENGSQYKITSIETDENGNQVIIYEPVIEGQA